ncbi:c-type cytochrome [Flavobacteriaceae bacterium Ap0902]|nr:c-type cytochrome [Flavobacteriaceae bacterium Ap0902]
MVNWEHFKWKYLAALFLAVAFSWSNAQEGDAISGDPSNGESLFNTHCAACHALDKKLIGPALGGVVERLQDEQGLGRDWLHSWIKDNEALRASGDEYAVQVFEDYNQTLMTAFPQLSDQDIDDVLAYTSNPPVVEEVVEETAVASTDESSLPVGALIIGFSVLAALLIWLLVKVNTLVKLSTAEGGELAMEDSQSFAKVFEKNKKLAYAVLGLLGLLVFYGLWVFMIGIGVDKGYQPEQPIYFSHKIHAGEQGIDCQYCHSSAKYGKVSGIPSPNLCMNCHYQIQEYTGDYVEEGKSKQFYTEEMQKIYQSIGFDKDNLTYTGEEEPIEWARIHNMPDFVYFNHAQHVVAGEEAIKNAKGVDQVCYACHGRVDQMDEVQMANDFTMGWCIECHRETEVDMNNEYNKEYYAQLHEKLKQQYGEEATITVDAIGGLECGKCHY